MTIPERRSGTCSSASDLRLDWRSFAANTATSTEVPFDRSRQIQRVARRPSALVPSNWRLCAFGPGGQRRLSRRLRCCEALRCPAKTKVFVGLHTKFGVSSFCRFADVADFEALVTDTGLSTAEALRYSVLGPQVIRT